MKSIISFRNGSLVAAACVFVAGALFAAAVATGARSQGTTKAEKSTLVVNGSHWEKASANERRAFLVGVANMIVAEMAYAERHNVERPPVCDRIAKAVADLKFPDIEARITRWYEAHPEEQSTPIMAVIWNDIVKKSESK